MKFTIYLLVTFIIFFQYGNAQNYKEALDIYKENPDKAIRLLKLDLKKGDKKNQANAANLIGIIEASRKNYELAFNYYFKAANINLSEKNSHLLSDNYNRIGTLYYRLRDYVRAKEYYLKAQKAGLNNEYLHHNLGTVYQRLNKFDSAVFFLSSARNMIIKSKNKTLLFEVLCELGHAFYYTSNYQESIKWYKDLLHYAIQEDNSRYKGFAYNNIGNAYHDAKKYDSAIIFLTKAIPLKTDKKILTTYLNLAECYKEIGQLQLAKRYFAKAINSDQSEQDISDVLTSFNQLVELYAASGSVDSVSMYVSDLTNIVAYNTNKTSSVKKEADLLSLQHQIMKRNLEFEIKKRDKKIIFWSIISVLLLISSCILIYFKVPQMIIYRYNLIKKQNDELKKTVSQLKELRD